MKVCDCIKQVDEKLKPHGIQVHAFYRLQGPMNIGVCVGLVRSDLSGRPPKQSAPNVYASFCPFCGEKYPEGTASAETPA